MTLITCLYNPKLQHTNLLIKIVGSAEEVILISESCPWSKDSESPSGPDIVQNAEGKQHVPYILKQG